MPVRAIIEAALTIFGIGGMGMFIQEEALQTAGMGMYLSLRAKDYDTANKMLAIYIKRIDIMRDFSLPLYGTMNYIMKPAFEEFLAASKGMKDVYVKLIKDGLTEAGLPLTSTIRLDSRPSGARMYKYTGETPEWEDTKLATPETFKYEGYQSLWVALIRYDPREKHYRHKHIMLRAVAGEKIEHTANLYENIITTTSATPLPREDYILAGAYES